VYGIPGFEGGGQEPAAVKPLGEADAIEIAADHYELVVVQATRLDTERDDTFRLDAAGGTFVLKIAHPADTRQALDLETQAVAYATRADAALPLPRILPSTNGDFAPALANHGGRLARLLSWLPGTPLHETAPTDEQVGELGRTLGHLTLALRGFEHPAAHRSFAWDVVQFPALAAINAEVGNELTTEVFRRFAALVAPKLDALPRQVVHNDFNTGNVLVDPTGPRFVTGIIDFGDVVHTARIGDLAVGLSYQIFPLGRTWDEVEPFIEAYRMVVSLEPLELDVLRDLVAVRFAQRILIYQWMQRGDPAALDFATQGNLAALESLLREP
jgi:Ser/Thr protein kinase RdoA (MazF antagonist)